MIRTSGPDISAHWIVNENGTFHFRVPGDRVVTVSASHPLCKPHPERGSVALIAARDDVLLELVGGPRARFRTSAQFEIYSIHEPHVEHRVLLYRDLPEGRPLSAHPLMSEDGTFVFGGFEPGTYTLWIDSPKHAPLVLRNVTLTDGETDLGHLTFGTGTGVRVGILTSPGTSAPRIMVSVQRLQDPAYRRWMTSDGEAEAVLRGLGPGRFKVMIGLIWNTQKSVSHEITADGTTDVQLVFDFR
jgi:hypothetical protein